ncbi:LacI family DNA-binding transcriptional regulator [Bordetella genomosp. 9]|uniref:Transcriptional regulator n=1 Tax=Bordetella genomosp. 9 TaxID=1416803 RepID=A0A1W6YUW8_9BORD|nr:LacI family DNA-binding transcriptional regulator [Bordetella genomosp. 9]ARP84892.1 transcriptional regulator [Bordetella genomosp. 9]ARP88982.1 transcriptional regulator [Bordetella genomosp. 9]
MTVRKSRSTRRAGVTMADVARHAGVSAITVSRALRTPEKVQEAVRQRIREACERLGYVPNHAASSLASARSRTIVVLIPSLSNAVFVDILTGIKEVLDAHAHHMHIGLTGYSLEEEETLLRNYLQHSPDGLILTGIDHNPGVWKLLEARDIPTVHTIETLDGEQGLSVGFSQFDSGYAAGRHLIDRGYRHIGIIGAQLDPRSLRRCEGCRQALRDAGMYDAAREIMTPSKSSLSLGAELLEAMLRDHPECDALFFCNDDLAQGAVFQCGRLGIDVPGRMGLIGFHDLSGTAWTTPPLSTIATPRYEIGRSAATLLMNHLEGRPNPQRHMDLGFRLVQREST